MGAADTAVGSGRNKAAEVGLLLKLGEQFAAMLRGVATQDAR